MTEKLLPPIHPGHILLHEFLKPMEISIKILSEEISVSVEELNEIVQHKHEITEDTANCLGKFFNMSSQFWLNLQARYDLEIAGDLLKLASAPNSTDIFKKRSP